MKQSNYTMRLDRENTINFSQQTDSFVALLLIMEAIESGVWFHISSKFCARTKWFSGQSGRACSLQLL